MLLTLSQFALVGCFSCITEFSQYSAFAILYFPSKLPYVIPHSPPYRETIAIDGDGNCSIKFLCHPWLLSFAIGSIFLCLVNARIVIQLSRILSMVGWSIFFICGRGFKISYVVDCPQVVWKDLCFFCW